MKAIYTTAKTALLLAQFDLEADAYMAQLVGGYIYDPTHATTADLDGQIAPAAAVTGITVAAGVARCDDVNFDSVAGPDPITGVVIHRSTGELLSYCSQRADTVPLNITPTGDDLTFSFDYLVKI